MKEKLKTKLRRNMRIRTLSLLTVMSAVSLSAIAAAPTVSTEAKKAADMINADAPMQKMLAELTSPQGQKWRFNIQMEIVRIASPSRSEMRRQQELMRRFTEEPTASSRVLDFRRLTVCLYITPASEFPALIPSKKMLSLTKASFLRSS